MRRGFCGIGIEAPKFTKNVGGLYRAAFCFDADFLFTVGEPRRPQREDVNRTERHLPHFVFRDCDDLLVHLPVGAALVVVEIADGAKTLAKFVHPERAIYVLGPEDGSVSPELAIRASAVVQIATRCCLNVAQAAAVVLYDRWAKTSERVEP